MKFQLKMLFLGTLAGSLCSCSVLGKRQESTKKDLDESMITQMRILGKKDASTTGVTSNGTTTANGKTKAPIDSALAVNYTSRFLQDNLDADKYVVDKDINFNQVTEKTIDGKKFTMPGDVDRLSLFCGLGGKINATLKKITPDDDFKEELKYEPKAIEDVQAKMVQVNAACEDNIHEVFAEGTATFNLDDVDLDRIALNTHDNNGNLRDYLLKEINKNQKRLNPNQPVEVTKVLFKNLPKELIDQFTASFDPNLNTVTISVKKNIQYCTPESGKSVAFVLEKGQMIPATKIELSEDKKKITIVTLNKIKRDDLAKLPLTVGNGDQQITLEDLKFSDQKISIISNNEFEEETTYTLELTDPAVKSEKTETTTTEPKPEIKDGKGQPNTEQKTTTTSENTTSTTSTGTILPLNPNSASSVEAKKSTPKKKSNQATNTTLASNKKVKKPATTTEKKGSAPTSTNTSSVTNNYLPAPYFLQPNTPDTTNLFSFQNLFGIYGYSTSTSTANKPAGTTASNATKESSKSAATSKPFIPYAIKSIPPVAAAFPADVSSSWFSLKLNGYAKKFYKDGDYEPGDANWEFWDDSQYTKLSYNDATVKDMCSKFTYQRNLHFAANILPPSEANSKEYKKLLFDQYNVKDADGERPSPIDAPIEQLVTASLDTPNGLKNQTWDIKICFGDDGKFTAFLSSDDSRAASYTRSSDGSIVLNQTKSNHWLQVAKSPDAYVPGKSPPPGFNSERKSRKPSMLGIICDAGGVNCTVDFQLKFQRNFEGSMMMAYINKNHFTDQTVFGIGSTADEIYNKIANSFNKPNKHGGPKVNRNEIVVYGGFSFNPAQKGAADATYMSPVTLDAAGKVPPGSYVPNVSAHILFPGESSELYLNVKVRGA